MSSDISRFRADALDKVFNVILKIHKTKHIRTSCYIKSRNGINITGKKFGRTGRGRKKNQFGET